MDALAAIEALVEQDHQRVRDGTLQGPCASFLGRASTQPTGVILLLHGYSAGAWQFSELCPTLNQCGLHTYAARLPGHGAQHLGGGASWQELPTSHQAAAYGKAAAAAFELAAAVSRQQDVPLHVLGFSLGGALSLHLAINHGSALKSLTLVAPLLRPYSKRAWLIFRVLAALRSGRLTDSVPFSWGPVPASTPNGWVRPGHWHFRVGNLFAALTFARDVTEAARALRVPTQLIVTDADVTCDPTFPVSLLKKSAAPHWVLRFPASEAVPHGMLTKEENGNAASRQRIVEALRTFLLCGVGTDSV